LGFKVVASKPVTFTKAQTLDMNNNGKIDAVVVNLSQLVTGLDRSDFAVEGHTVTNVSTRVIVTTLSLEEQVPTSTNIKPNVAFVGEAKDLAGKSITKISPIKAASGFVLVTFKGAEPLVFKSVKEFTGIGKIPSDYARPVGSKLQFKATITKDGQPMKG
jgi:hypothetical protein